jgi:hypothetical protein
LRNFDVFNGNLNRASDRPITAILDFGIESQVSNVKGVTMKPSIDKGMPL